MPPKDDPRSERERAIAELVNRCGPSSCQAVVSVAAAMAWDASIDAAAKQIGVMIARYNSDERLQQIIRTEAAALKGDRNVHK